MSEMDLVKLYSGRILELTTRIPHVGRLQAPQGSARERSPLCGSSVSAEVVLSDGRVSEFAQQVKACALGQAAAAVTGAAIIGCTPEQIDRACEQLAAMLEGGPVPDAPFADFEALSAARDFRNRHASIQLALKAAQAAVRQASAQD